MRSSTKRNLSLAALLVALVGAGTVGTVAYLQRQQSTPDSTVAAAAAPEPEEDDADAEAESPAPAPPPGTEVVPAEESESDRGPAAASPAGPAMSFARAAGLHHAPDPLHLNSSAALLVDQDTGTVLASKNEQAVLPIASLTKLMTALLVLEAKQPLDEVLTIGADDVDTLRNSRSRLRVGTKLTREEALRLALMSSENRAAHVLGRSYPGGLQKIVKDMNTRAQQLGMKDTRYVDPTGLSNGNESTARDVALLVAAVAANPVLAGYSTTPTHLANLGGRTLQYRNSNRLVRAARAGWDIEVQKTGYIVEAGRCLTMLTELGGHKLIMVLLDAESNRARVADAERMRRWVVAQYGLPETLAKADPAPRKLAAASKGGQKTRKSAVAAKEKSQPHTKEAAASARKDGKGAVASASAKKGDKSAVASASAKKDGKGAVASGKKKKEEVTARKGTRVRQTFAAGKDDGKS